MTQYSKAARKMKMPSPVASMIMNISTIQLPEK